MANNLATALADMFSGKSDLKETTSKMYEIFYGEKPNEQTLDEIMEELEEDNGKV